MPAKILSYNMGEGSRLLADALGVKRLRQQAGIWKPKPDDTIINWGCVNVPHRFLQRRCKWVNHPHFVSRVADKVNFFRRHNDDRELFNTVPYFFSKHDAADYLRDHAGGTIVCRTLTASHEGKGIVMAARVDGLVDAPLYTAYVKKRAEYRIHVMAGEVIDEVQKKRRLGHEAGDKRIFNTANGYVFARTDVVVPQCVRDEAVKAVKAMELDFGAVDVIYNGHYDKAYVLEINSAPGIEGTTVQRYAAGLRRFYNA